MKKETIYCLPGLGLDHRLFEKITIPNADLHFINWLDPLKGESISSYAKRISNEIKDDDFSLLGVSLGGIISIEIAKFRSVNHLYLISTVKSVDEMPTYFRLMNRFPINTLNTTKFAMEMGVTLKPFYDQADQNGNQLFEKMVKEANPNFINWGVRQISQWESKEPLQTPFTHIHGTDDLIFPIKNIDEAITIKGGTHFAIYNNAEKISRLIEVVISNKK